MIVLWLVSGQECPWHMGEYSYWFLHLIYFHWRLQKDHNLVSSLVVLLVFVVKFSHKTKRNRAWIAGFYQHLSYCGFYFWKKPTKMRNHSGNLRPWWDLVRALTFIDDNPPFLKFKHHLLCVWNDNVIVSVYCFFPHWSGGLVPSGKALHPPCLF